MPELPEVETMVRGIRETVRGAVLEEVVLCPCRCKPMLIEPKLTTIQKRTHNLRVSDVRRRAKRVVIELENGSAFVIEPRMTGLMLLSDPPNVEHLRIEWKFRVGRKKVSVWFWDRRGLGTMRLYNPEEIEQALGLHRLGPDALEMTPELWVKRLKKTNREIKVALLDQKLVAGIGNLYASEILFQAGIDPRTVTSRLTKARIQLLHESTLDILNTAIKYEGSTLGDGTYRNVLNQDGGYQNEHRVYAKANENCPRCEKGTIQRIVQAQRSTFFCAKCQRKR